MLGHLVHGQKSTAWASIPVKSRGVLRYLPATERETKNRQCMGEQERAQGSSSGGAQRIYRRDPSDLMAQHHRPRGFDSIGNLEQNRPTKSYSKNSKSKQLAGLKSTIGILLPLGSCLVRTMGYFYVKQARLY